MARLQLDGVAALPKGTQVAFHLHPPLLRALGMQRKLKLGRWFVPVLRVLRRGRVLRGTPLDPFGYAHVRRVERELPGEYLALVELALERLSPATLAARARARRAARAGARLRADQARRRRALPRARGRAACPAANRDERRASMTPTVCDALLESLGWEHERVQLVHDAESGLQAVIAIHSTVLGPSLGGLRIRRYEHGIAEGLDDALRLSRAMTLKASAAGLSLGGGKAVVLDDGCDADTRAARLVALAREVERLGGAYITAEDIGTTTADMDLIAGHTSHVVGRTACDGVGGDPSPATARTVLGAIRAAFDVLDGSEQLSGRVVGVIGLGKVGGQLAVWLAEAGARVVAYEPVTGVAAVCAEAGIELVASPEELLARELDVVRAVCDRRHDRRARGGCAAVPRRLRCRQQRAEWRCRGCRARAPGDPLGAGLPRQLRRADPRRRRAARRGRPRSPRARARRGAVAHARGAGRGARRGSASERGCHGARVGADRAGARRPGGRRGRLICLRLRPLRQRPPSENA